MLPVQGPGPREYHAMITDVPGDRVLVYGGLALNGDTLSWDGAIWTQLRTGYPSARGSMIAAPDGDRATVVIAGGSTFQSGAGQTYHADTFVFNDNTWSQVTGPEILRRRGAAAAVDQQRGVTVMYGGTDAAGALLGDTVEWAGDAWVQVATTGPGPRRDAVMVHEPSGGVLLFGGHDESGPRGDTWRWDGMAWTLVSAGGPPAREDAAIAWDAARGEVVLFGGLGSAGLLNDTWAWDGMSWTQLASTGPAPRSGHAMAYDLASQRVVLFGGDEQGETWEWDGATWTLVGTGAQPLQSTAMAYDGAAFRISRFGGQRYVGGPSSQMWFYIGAGEWFTQTTTQAPLNRSDHVVVYDALRRAVIVTGGNAPATGTLHNDARAYSYANEPAFTRQPEPVAIAAGRTAQFHVEVFARTPDKRFRWYRNGVALSDSAHIGGSLAPLLTIRNVVAGDTAMYSCRISDPCSTYTSTAAQLTVLCAADLSGDGLIDFSDYLEFLNLFEASHVDADFNSDGLVDFADYLEFLNAYESGC